MSYFSRNPGTRVANFCNHLYNPPTFLFNRSQQVKDQNDALTGQGAADASPQGDQPNNHNQTMESLLETESLSVELPQVGEIRKGTIASINTNQILVSIGAKSEGIIAG